MRLPRELVANCNGCRHRCRCGMARLPAKSGSARQKQRSASVAMTGWKRQGRHSDSVDDWCRCGARTGAASTAPLLFPPHSDTRWTGVADTASRCRRAPNYPDLSALCPAAVRMQRATYDMLGLVGEGAGDTRSWLRHNAWPTDYFPLRQENSGSESFELGDDHYPLVAVQGDGVHEIPVGPVHAGIIEPGHFRFSVVGENVLRLEERLGYTHKGIDKLFESTPLNAGHRLAGRVSGDSTVAYAWAYCMAPNRLRQTAAVLRARVWLRALMLERERVANHLGDLGALGNDAALAFGLAQFFAAQGGLAASESRSVRPSLHDGPHRSRRRRR